MLDFIISRVAHVQIFCFDKEFRKFYMQSIYITFLQLVLTLSSLV